jgi:hypothetical protein
MSPPAIELGLAVAVGEESNTAHRGDRDHGERTVGTADLIECRGEALRVLDVGHQHGHRVLLRGVNGNSADPSGGVTLDANVCCDFDP